MILKQWHRNEDIDMMTKTSTPTDTDKSLPPGSALIRQRIDHMRSQLGETGVDENLLRFRRMLETLAGGDTPAPWSEFKERLEVETTGFVLTAHPTFSLSSEARDYAKAVLTGDPDAPEPSRLHPDQAPTLEEELTQSEAAATNIRRAVRRLYRTAIDVAAERYPDDWQELVPGFCTIASWVGFDLDGRTDIGWETSLEFRYVAALKGLDQLDELASDIEASSDSLRTLNAGLECLRSCFELGASTLADVTARTGLARLNSLAMEKRDEKENAIRAINDALADLMASDLPLETKKSVALLRAAWQSMGLSLNHIHFRLNAVQLHNAIRSEIKLDRAPDESASRRHYLSEITALLDRVKPVNVHYGTLAREGTTAKRLFMLAAQFEKHFDRHTPIRLLVAESDTPFTLLTALYYARLFGVEDHVEISPLFETSSGLARGDRVISELLDNPHFLKYLRDQGRFCVQLGFSDSGRYIGQPAGTLAIERFKLRLVQLWIARGLGDVQLVFFDTHGESIGRGAHPGSLRQRFLYTHSPKVRAEIKGLFVPHKHEVSFQGGDGYLWFQTADDTLAALVDFLEVRHAPHTETPVEVEDELYARSDWSLDFFLTLKEYQDKLVADPGYIGLIDSFGPGLLFPTGSRAVVRQGGSGKISKLESVTQLRAIPHNAILQQLGYLANVVAGAGTAISRSPEGFEEVLENSPRLQLIMTLIGEASARSDIRTLAAYVDLINPDAWLAYADRESDELCRNGALRLSRILETAFDHEAISSLLRDIQRDEVKYRCFAERFAPSGSEALKSDIGKLHEVRIARIRRLYLLAMQIPLFSSRSDISLDNLIERLLRLDVPETLTQLQKIFPTSSEPDDDEEFGEDSDYVANTGGYADLHQEIFEPIRATYEEILDYSARIALTIGAVG